MKFCELPSFPRGSKRTEQLPSAPLEKVLSARESSYGGPDWACSPFCIFRPTGWIPSDFLFTLQKTESRWVKLRQLFRVHTSRAYKTTAKSTSLEPWFEPHVQRNIYLSLLHLEPQPGQEKATPVPDSILKAALLQRAAEDIRRILAIRGAKQPLSQLLQRGSVGDDLWQRFLRAEKEMEAELRDVVEEVSTHSLF